MLFGFSVDVTASIFPTGHHIAAHPLYKESTKTEGALFPWAPIKTSFGKVAAFYSSLYPHFLTTSLKKNCRKAEEKADYWKLEAT